MTNPATTTAPGTATRGTHVTVIGSDPWSYMTNTGTITAAGSATRPGMVRVRLACDVSRWVDPATLRDTYGDDTPLTYAGTNPAPVTDAVTVTDDVTSDDTAPVTVAHTHTMACALTTTTHRDGPWVTTSVTYACNPAAIPMGPLPIYGPHRPTDDAPAIHAAHVALVDSAPVTNPAPVTVACGAVYAAPTPHYGTVCTRPRHDGDDHTHDYAPDSDDYAHGTASVSWVGNGMSTDPAPLTVAD